MELLQLQYFLTVAELESISQAATRQGITQPAMSKTILGLERELETQLFDRRGNRIYLNENGRSFYHEIQLAFRHIADGVAALKDPDRPIEGELKLLVLEHRQTVTDCIATFKVEHPAVHFTILHDFSGKDSFDYDLAISTLPPSGADLDCAHIIKEPILLGVSKLHPFAQRQSVQMIELREERFIMMPERNSLHQIALSQCRMNGFEPIIGVVCDDPSYIRKFVALNLGITFFPSVSWRNLADKDIALVPLEEKVYRNSSIYWKKNRYLSNLAITFRDYLLARCKTLPVRF